MQIGKIFSLLLTASLLYTTACQKGTGSTSSASNDNCVQSKALRDGDVIPGQYIVLYKQVTGTETTSAKSTAVSVSAILRDHAIATSAVQASFSGEATGFVASLSGEQAADLKTDPSVSAVEPDRFIALSTCFTIVAPTLITWNVQRTGYGDGTGKTAWIVDTGIDTDHPDLNVDATRSRCFITGQTSVEDSNGHGTHVAGIIGAKNNNIGVLGVASGANLVALKVLDKDGEGKLSSIIQALNYISSSAKAGDVVNMSLGEEEPSEILDAQVQKIAAKGILFAIAAGNDNKPAINYSPARANGTNIFTVSAVDSLDNFASFSNYGNDAVDVAAPGVRILSTYTGGRYARMSGTSMATPHIAGLLLLNGAALNYSGTAKNDPDGVADKIGHK